MLDIVWAGDIARETGIPIALRGQPRLQSLLAFGEQRAAEASYRAAICAAQPEDLRRHLTLRAVSCGSRTST